MKKYIKQILAILAIILIVLGIFLYITFSPKNNTMIEKIGYPIIDSSFATSSIQWKKFVDEKDKVSFEYPSDNIVKVIDFDPNNIGETWTVPSSIEILSPLRDGLMQVEISMMTRDRVISTYTDASSAKSGEQEFLSELTPKEKDLSNNYSFRKIITTQSTVTTDKEVIYTGYYRKINNFISLRIPGCTKEDTKCIYVFEHVLDSIEFLQ